MSDRPRPDDHREITDLMPWYVNGTLGAFERQRVDEHLEQCEPCRAELMRERRLCEGMAVEPSVEYMPAASLKRLQAALDGRAVSESAPAPKLKPSTRRWTPWRGLAAASVAVAAVLAAYVTVDRTSQIRNQPAKYITVTIPDPRPPDEVIRAVFSPTVTLIDLQAILDEARLRIISGPTEAGVYSLAATSDRPVSASLGLLRSHPEVRFAESTRQDPRAQDGDARPRESP